MITLSDYFNYAQEIGSTEVRMTSNSKPEFRVNKKWVNSQFGEINPSQVRENFLALLEDESRAEFMNCGFVTGVQMIGNRLVEYVLSQTVNGLHGYFTWQNKKISLDDFSLPSTVFEILRKVSGVSIFTGPRGSGKSSLLKLLGLQMSEAGYRVAAFVDSATQYEDTEMQIYESQKMVGKALYLAKGFDIILVDSLNPQTWIEAISLGNMGVKVLMTLPFHSTESAMRRLSEELSHDDKIGRSRIVDTLQMALGLRKLEGLDGVSQIAFEVLYMTQDIRALIRNGDWSQVEKLVNAHAETTGMLSLNQSLLNLMLKRKIDLKVGFSESQSPEELDRMFEKIGL